MHAHRKTRLGLRCLIMLVAAAPAPLLAGPLEAADRRADFSAEAARGTADTELVRRSLDNSFAPAQLRSPEELRQMFGLDEDPFILDDYRLEMIGGDDASIPVIHPDLGTPIPATGGSGGGVGNGTARTTGIAAWNGYVRIERTLDPTSKDPLEVCTGILIAPRWVLTAGHCVRERPTRVQIGASAETWDKNRYDIASCKVHGNAINPWAFPTAARFVQTDPKGGCGFGKAAMLAGESDVDAISEHDLALLELAVEVPPEVATPRPLLIEASSDDEQAFTRVELDMFGYGFIFSPTLSATGSRCNPSNIGRYLATNRQRLHTKALSNVGEAILRIEAKPLVSPEFGELFGAMPGDSGGPLVVPAPDPWGREIVIGVLSKACTPDGQTIVTPTYTAANRKFIQDHVAPLRNTDAGIFGG